MGRGWEPSPLKITVCTGCQDYQYAKRATLYLWILFTGWICFGFWQFRQLLLPTGFLNIHSHLYSRMRVCYSWKVQIPRWLACVWVLPGRYEVVPHLFSFHANHDFQRQKLPLVLGQSWGNGGPSHLSRVARGRCWLGLGLARHPGLRSGTRGKLGPWWVNSIVWTTNIPGPLTHGWQSWPKDYS